MLTRNHVWLSAFVVIIFGTGLAAGVALDRTMHRPPTWRGPGGMTDRDHGPNQGFGGRGGDASRGDGSHEGGRGDGPPTQAFVHDLDQALDLSTDQEAKLTAIIDSNRPKMRQLQEEVSKRFTDEQQSLHDEIVKILTPAQVTKLNALEAERRSPLGFRGRGPRGGR